MLRFILLVVLLIGLNGCFVAPGMTMKSPNVSVGSTAAAEIKPHFIPVNIELVRYLNRTEKFYHGDTYYYHIEPYDILNIYVWGHPELNVSFGSSPSSTDGENTSTVSTSAAPMGYLVDPDGNIFFPMIGTTHVAGKTTQVVRKQIMHALKKYVRSPQVDVRVSGFRSKKIYVMGEILHPGLLPLTDTPMSVMDAINLSGGMDPQSADPGHIFIIRGDYAKPDVYWLDIKSADFLLLAENFGLRSDDVVFVSTAGVARWNRAMQQILPTVESAWLVYSISRQARV